MRVSDAQPQVPESRVVRIRKVKIVATVLMWPAIIAMLVGAAGSQAWIWVLALVVGFVIAGTINAISLRRQARRFTAENVLGVAALARGDLKQARELFWQWAEGTRSPHVSAIARHNLGWTLMRQGELQHAIDVLTDNEDRNERALKTLGMLPTGAVDLALCHGLLGMLEGTEKWMAEAEQRVNELTCTPTVPAMKAFARAVLDCRDGRCADAARMLDEHWADYEATLTGDTLRPLRIVRAFAIAAAGPRDAGLAESAFAMARPAYPGEYDFLGTAWPEMAAFLVSHQLTR